MCFQGPGTVCGGLPHDYHLNVLPLQIFRPESHHSGDMTLHFKFNQFLTTVPTFAVRETDFSRHNGGPSGTPLKPLRDDSALRALSTLRGLRGAPEVPPLCRETQSLGQ